MAPKEQPEGTQPPRELTPAARRALQEAEERRRIADARKTKNAASANEISGPKGPEPTRYGDWEKGGIASDF